MGLSQEQFSEAIALMLGSAETRKQLREHLDASDAAENPPPAPKPEPPKGWQATNTAKQAAAIAMPNPRAAVPSGPKGDAARQVQETIDRKSSYLSENARKAAAAIKLPA